MSNIPKKIFTLGDIHIFKSKRFEEHIHLFNKLYKQMDIESPDLVVLVGDIVDSKARLSPEQIDICRDLLLNLSNRCPVIMIPGNHDCNLQNEERLDSLSPIVKSLQEEAKNKIHYFKDSGIYELYDINWAVWSCIQNQKNPFVGSNYDKSKYTVGLYHGIVSGSILDSGIKPSGEINVDEFTNCDIVMLGDIHKQQSFRNGEINYTGSFIQTNVAENPNGTYLVYDWKNNGYSVDVREIENEYSTIVVEYGQPIPNIKKTQTLNLKFDTNTYSSIDVRAEAKKLSNDNDIKVSVVPFVKDQKQKDKIKLKEIEEFEDLNDADYIELYLTENKDKFDIKDLPGDIKKINKLDKKFSKGYKKDYEFGDFDVFRVVLNNFLSFSPNDNIINFDYEDLLGITGKNRVGKSSIIKAIQFCLFHQVPNNSSFHELINKHNKDKDAYVIVYFKKEGKIYKVKRTIIPNKRTKVVVSFYEVDANDKVIHDLTDEKRQETDKVLNRYIGIDEAFDMLSIFSAQKKNLELIDCKNAERLKTVNKYMGLHTYELKESNVLKELTDKNKDYNNLISKFDSSIDINKLTGELKRNETLIKLARTEEKDLRDELFELEDIYGDVITVFNSNAKIAKKEIQEPTHIRELIQECNNSIDAFKEKIQANNKIVEESNNLLQYKAQQFRELYGCEPADYKSDTKTTNELNGKTAVLKHQIKEVNNQLSKDVCNSCGKPVTEEDKEKYTAKLKGYEEELIAINTQISQIEAREKEVSSKLKELEDIIDSIDNIEEKENIRVESNIKDKQIKINTLENELLEYDTIMEAKNTVSILSDKVNEYKSEKAAIEDALYKIKENTGNYSNKIKHINGKIAEYNNNIDVIKDKEEELRLLKIYRKMVNKDGLPLFILNNKLHDINDKVNLVVSQVFDFSVEFSIDSEKGDLNIHFDYEGDQDKSNVGLASGSETFIINLCIKVGLAQVSSLPKSTTIYIDEGYDVLDKESIEKLPQLFAVLTNYYKNVVTISHMDDIKDMCNNHIRLENTGKYTVVK